MHPPDECLVHNACRLNSRAFRATMTVLSEKISGAAFQEPLHEWVKLNECRKQNFRRCRSKRSALKKQRIQSPAKRQREKNQ
jgi:hypothetical protein